MKNCVGELGWPKCVGKLGINGGVKIGMPNSGACLFKVRPGIIKTLSYMWGKLNLPIFLINVGLLTLIKIFQAKPCPSLPII